MVAEGFQSLQHRELWLGTCMDSSPEGDQHQGKEEGERRPWSSAGFNGSSEFCAALCTYIIFLNKTEEAINK